MTARGVMSKSKTTAKRRGGRTMAGLNSCRLRREGVEKVVVLKPLCQPRSADNGSETTRVYFHARRDIFVDCIDFRGARFQQSWNRTRFCKGHGFDSRFA